MTTAVTIRPATPGDAPGIHAIYAPVVEKTAISLEEAPPTVDEMAARIAATLLTHPWLVAERDGRIAGYAYASAHNERAAYRWSANVSVYVAGHEWRRGVGRALYASLFAELDSRGFHALFAGVTLPNAGSVGLHETLGFSHIGTYREAGYKFGRWHDVGWWQRLLDDRPAPRAGLSPVQAR